MNNSKKNGAWNKPHKIKKHLTNNKKYVIIIIENKKWGTYNERD